jgi:uncharacterized protein (DUF58 family)
VGALSIAPEILAAVRDLEVRARRSVREGLGGRFKSAVRGAGIEFAEVREYVAGDDARTLDWNVSARTGRLHVKRFEEEREQTLFFLVDGSRSCRIAGSTRSWAQAAGEAMALLGLAAAQAGDRTGAVFFSEGIDRVVPPRHGTTALLSLLAQHFAHEAPHAGTDLDAALRQFVRLRARPCLAVVLSDLQRLPSAATLRAAARRHDLVVLALRPAWFDRLPERGVLRLEDVESGARFAADLGDRRVRAQLSRRIEREREGAAALLRRAGAQLVELSIERPLLPPLVAWARRRALERER